MNIQSRSSKQRRFSKHLGILFTLQLANFSGNHVGFVSSLVSPSPVNLSLRCSNNHFIRRIPELFAKRKSGSCVDVLLTSRNDSIDVNKNLPTKPPDKSRQIFRRIFLSLGPSKDLGSITISNNKKKSVNILFALLAATAIIMFPKRALASLPSTVSDPVAASSAFSATVDLTTKAAAVVTPAAAAAATPISNIPTRALGTFNILPSRAEVELTLRLLYASLGGAAVGLERSTSDHPAGVRTMALVSLGACAFTLCSIYGFLFLPHSPAGHIKLDPSRLASNVASGVGFIGAGVITNNRKANGVYDRQSSVNGLTTAAAIWVAAAVGVATGVGLYFVAGAAAISTIMILKLGSHFKHANWGSMQRVLSVHRERKRPPLSSIQDKEKLIDATVASSASRTSVNDIKFTSKEKMEKKHDEVSNENVIAPKSILKIPSPPQKERKGRSVESVKTQLPVQKAPGNLDGEEAVSKSPGETIRNTEKKIQESDTSDTNSSFSIPENETVLDMLTDPMLEKYLWGMNPAAKSYSSSENDEGEMAAVFNRQKEGGKGNSSTSP